MLLEMGMFKYNKNLQIESIQKSNEFEKEETFVSLLDLNKFDQKQLNSITFIFN